MKPNSAAIGNRVYEGEYNRIKGAGLIKIKNSTVNAVHSAGDLKVNNSTIGKVRCAGAFHGNEVKVKDFNGAGNVKLKGYCEASTFIVTGDMSAEYLKTDILRNCLPSGHGYFSIEVGTLEWKGSYKAITFENFYPMKLSCDYTFQNMISSAPLYSDEEITCDRFYSFHKLSVNTINADTITIIPYKEVKIENLVGSNIIITKKFVRDKAFQEIPKSSKYQNTIENENMITVNRIEGDCISIENTNVDFISGADIVIGDLCIVNRVECTRSIKIAEKAIVNEVVKL